jgi:hypothetical protein
MLKWARRILVFLLLGAIVNVAVAWGCVLFAGPAPGDVAIIVRQGSPICEITTYERIGFQCLMFDEDVEWPAYIRHVGSDELTKYPGNLKTEAWTKDGAAVVTRAGWPMSSMEGWELDRWRLPLNAPSWKFDRNQNVRWGWSWDRVAAGKHVTPLMPLRPMLRGFTVDTGLYATLAWLLTVGRSRTCRLIRQRRGQCPTCGYPRGTSPVCTECGEALPC